MPYESKAIANELLDIAQAAKRPISHLKLQKLEYFAHGWHLAITKRPLINERIEAWKFGPVVPSVYREFRDAGSAPITDRRALAIRNLDSSENSFSLYTPSIKTCGLSEKEDAFASQLLHKIWAVYGKFSAIDLSEATHHPGTPWHAIRSKYGDVKNVDIPDDLIREYFESVALKK